uniref:NADH dehydrogenase subunit 4L n=1 Tax=Benedenia seriolae TaxID=160838 RepID=D7S9V1_BENSE|nr:NADH dehydrogenase subunit 4L [Benedenia seriolae]ADI24684.1 NADH dehydrogenase subunit 4L [Benedenia seriolae]
MLAICYIGFFLSNFQFLSGLVVLENVNILYIIISSYQDFLNSNIPFLIFMIIATISVVLSLGVLSRVWTQLSILI